MTTMGWLRRHGDCTTCGPESAGHAPAAGARRVGGLAAAGVLAAGALSSVLLAAAPPGAAGASPAHTKTIHVSTATVPKVGIVLTTGAGLTLYRFTADPVGMSTCTGACAKIWPPFLAAKGDHIAGPRGLKGLSVIDVGSGHWQVAFHGVALYRFQGDSKKGEAKGQGIEGKWFAVLKDSNPATSAAAAPAAPATSSPTSSPPPTTTPATAPPPTPATAPPPTPTTTAPPPTPTTAPPPPTTTTTTMASGGGYGY
jgi:predicted lipoprotein with Yx(FWY)xxD motif